MNYYLVLIVFILFAQHILNLVIEKENLKSLTTKLPDEFVGIYSPKKYEKSQDYLKTNTKFTLVKSGISLILTLGFILSGALGKIDILARGFGFGETFSGLIFFGILYLIVVLFNLPFSIYHTFVIEERFGFNKTTWATFIKDLVKSFVLNILIMGVLLTLVFYLFETQGRFAWLLSWIVVSVVSFFLIFIAPISILPLFNKFTLLPDGELRQTIYSYCKKQKIRVKNIFQIDGSRRSTKANAYFTGFGKTKRIALFDTLIDQMSTKQIVSVLAHEIGHSKLGHIKKSMILQTIETGLMLFILNFFISNPLLFEAFKIETLSVYGGILLFSILYTPFTFFLGIVSMVLSRAYEYQADRFAARTVGTSTDLIDALKKLSVSNLSNLTPGKMKVFFQYSHPPVLQRIVALRKLQNKKSGNFNKN